ncbi:ATP-dependent Clp protease adapter ClpS [Rarobacter incanus]|uniref:ATP-dependent Clp protease adapter protein ClpS n=1 Tax=Rarobacter incanus TaxID=153494 RepID=A0A542SRP6_9MICO|nr:ATP-dependent Clp protease adapter ClpS [Rarobacter incanus]TQK77291.1 ATP-dependent Clp protease adaptor protein ClpS [Rarobacter incanus]
MAQRDEAELGSATRLSPEGEVAVLRSPAPRWHVVVWDDPVNLMTYVEFVFRRHFGYGADHARQLMLRVHNEGKTIVFTGSRERVEADVQAMHQFGLQATMQRAEQ